MMRKQTAVIKVIRRSSEGISVEHRPVSTGVVSSDDEQSYMSLPGVRPQNSHCVQCGSTRTRPKAHY